jgi:Nuclear pore protein 84 / 107
MKIVLQETQLDMEELYPEPGTSVLAVALNDRLTDLDERQIRTIEWFHVTGSDELVLPGLKSGNILFRRFLRYPTLNPLTSLVAGHLNSVKALAERVPCSQFIRPDQHSDHALNGSLGQNALEYAQHSALWQLFAAFDRWEEYAVKYMNTYTSRKDKLAEKQHKNEVRTALGEFIDRAKAMVLSDEGLSAVLDETLREEEPEVYAVLARIRDLYVPEIILRMHEVFIWGGDHLDARYYLYVSY